MARKRQGRHSSWLQQVTRSLQVTQQQTLSAFSFFCLFVFFGCCVCAAAKCKKRVPKKIAQSTKASGFHSMIHNIGPYPVSKRASNYLVIFDGYLR